MKNLQCTSYNLQFVLLSLFTFYLLLVTFSIPVYAQNPPPIIIHQPVNGGVQVNSRSSGDVLQAVLTNGITILFTVAGIGAVAMVLWGAFEWITSSGQKEKLDSARKKISTALIGLVILGMAFVIIRIVGGIIGFDPLQSLSIPYLGR